MKKLLLELGGAAAGGFAGSWAATNFLLKTEKNPNGFIERKDGFGLDDVVLWLAISAGSLAGLKLTGKLAGGS